MAWTGPSAKGTKQERPRVRASSWPVAARRVQEPPRQSRMRGAAPGRAGAGVPPGGRALGRREGEFGSGELDHVEAELRDRGVEPGDPVGQDAGREDGHLDGGVDELEQFGDVDVLAGQARTDHVVGVGEQFDAGAAQVGVQAAGRHEHGLARLQHRVPHQQQGDHADVPRTVGGHADRRGAGVGVAAAGLRQALAGGDDRGDERGGLRATAGPSERGAEGVIANAASLNAEDGGQRLELVHARARSRPAASAGVRRPAATSNGVRAYSTTRVWASRPRSCGPGRRRRPAGAFSSANPASRLRARRVHLDRQRPVGRQHLQQERQPPAEPRRHLRPKLAAGRGLDHLSK